jgi:acetyl esterase/lipase
LRNDCQVRTSRDILTEPPPPDADARIAYGSDPLQFGDLRLPRGDGPHALVIVIHGGYWQAIYNLTHAGHLCVALAEAGIATWSLEFRRIGDPGGGWPGTLDDVASGVGHARSLEGVDLDRVVLFGHSAGGQLALWAAAQRILPLRAVVSVAGVVDLHEAWERQLGGGIVKRFLGGTPGEVPERYDAASPRALLPLGVHQVLVHGTEDPSVPPDFAREYVDAAGGEAELVELEGAGHFEPVDPQSREWPEVLALLERLLGATPVSDTGRS